MSGYFYYSSTPIGYANTLPTVSRKGYASDNYINLEINLAASATGSMYRSYDYTQGWINASQPNGGNNHGGGGWKNNSSNITSIVFNYGGGTFTGTIKVYQGQY